MEAETERSRASWSSKRRKPLSDSSNLVIPTSTILRKLSSSLSAKPPFPNPNSKPHVSSSATKPDTKSHTSSIGSSNFKENAPNPTNIPQPPASPPLLSITNSALAGAVGAMYGPLHGGANEAVLKMLGSERCQVLGTVSTKTTIPDERRTSTEVIPAAVAALVDEKGEPLTPTSAWRAAERLAKVAIMRKSLNRVSDLHGFENARFRQVGPFCREDTERGLGLSPCMLVEVTKMDDGDDALIFKVGNGSEDAFDPLVVYSRRQTSRKTKDRGTPVALPYTFSPLQKTKGNVNADTVPLTYPVLKKSKDKGKAAVVPFTSYLVENMRDGRKEIATPHSLFPLRKTKDNGKAVSMPINFPSLENTKNKRKKIDAPFSCPPLPRTKKIRNEFNQAGDIGISKSCTVPHPKCKKKRCRLMPEQDVSKHNLPQEFIEQQRAYFKEVDEFELPEEEISESELDEAETRNTFQDMK
ncbi:unnamed protein product [Camellia sinensis]